MGFPHIFWGHSSACYRQGERLGTGWLLTTLWTAVPKIRVALGPHVASKACFSSELLPSSPSSHTDTGPTCPRLPPAGSGAPWRWAVGRNSLSCTHLSRCLNQTFRGCPGRGPSDTSVQCTTHLQPLAHFFKQVSSTYTVLAFADPKATETSNAQCLPLRDALSSQRQMEDRALGRLRDAPQCFQEGESIGRGCRGAKQEPSQESSSWSLSSLTCRGVQGPKFLQGPHRSPETL